MTQLPPNDTGLGRERLYKAVYQVKESQFCHYPEGH